MNTIIQTAANFPRAAFSVGVVGSFLELSWRKGGIKFAEQGLGRITHLWVDYPQALAAGCLALRLLGTGSAGVATFAAFALLPIIFKATVAYEPKGSFSGRTAGCLDHITRLVAKVFSVAGGVFLVIAAPSWVGVALLSLASYCAAVNLSMDASYTAGYAMGSHNDFYDYGSYIVAMYR